MFSSGPRYEKLKTNLRLSVNRMKLLQKKKTEEALKARKEIADYILAGKVDRARIRVEHIIREDYMVEALEMLEMFCDLLLARFGIIESMKEVDAALDEPVCTLIWCAPRLFSEVQELKPVAEQLTAKYGHKYVEEFCKREENSKVSQRVRNKLSVAAPPAWLVERYLIEIAKSYNVPYEPNERILAQAEASSAAAFLLDYANQPEAQSNSRASQPPPIPQNGPYVTQMPGALPPAYPAYPPPAFGGYPTKPEQSFADEKPSGDVYDNLGAPGYSEKPAKPSAPPAGNVYESGANASAQAPAAGFNFSLPDVPTSLGPPAANSNSDMDFDELQRRFNDLKRKK